MITVSGANSYITSYQDVYKRQDHIRKALSRGKHAVSANKGPLAWYYRELRDLAKEKGVCFFFETTVMAGTPVFNMADNCLQYCKIDKEIFIRDRL